MTKRPVLISKMVRLGFSGRTKTKHLTCTGKKLIQIFCLFKHTYTHIFSEETCLGNCGETWRKNNIRVSRRPGSHFEIILRSFISPWKLAKETHWGSFGWILNGFSLLQRLLSPLSHTGMLYFLLCFYYFFKSSFKNETESAGQHTSACNISSIMVEWKLTF